jgi:DNA repair ATPase RecN
MTTASERYRRHNVWDTLRIKKEALTAARFGEANAEQQRADVIDWLREAEKSKLTRQPALYLGVLDQLRDALNGLGTAEHEFNSFMSGYRSQAEQLQIALRALPLPSPRDLKDTYADLLDKEIEARTSRLDDLHEHIVKIEKSLAARQSTLDSIEKKAAAIADEVEAERDAIADVKASVRKDIDRDWGEQLHDWWERRKQFDEEQDAAILSHAASLAATARAGETLAEHAAGSLSAADWSSRAQRERRAAQWIRFGAAVAFVLAGAIGWFIVSEAVASNFDLTVGDGILRASVAAVIGAFGALLLRESGRHFREADTAEDVSLSLKALAPFYASSDSETRVAARAQVGDAVLVRNVLSRFAHRDAAKLSGGGDGSDLSKLVEDSARALGKIDHVNKTMP